MKSYETLQAMARKNTAFHSKINGMGVVQGELSRAIDAVAGKPFRLADYFSGLLVFRR
jgi:hypothetical protein